MKFLTLKRLQAVQVEYWLFPLFAIIYFFSLTFLYVEGDDAYSIFYHALGREKAIQLPYSPYQGMMDVVLSIFPANEGLLRVAAISIHALFGILFPFTIIRLIRSLDLVKEDYLLCFIILIPFLMPEFIFFGLYYHCSTIAITLMLFSHILFRRFFQATEPHDGNWLHFVAAVLLFGIGIGFRWDAGFYLLFVLLDIFFLSRQKKLLKQFVKVAATGLSVGAIFLVVLKLQGISVFEILNRYKYSQSLIEGGREFSWMINIGSGLSLFTPALLLFSLIGFIVTLRSGKYLLLLGFLALYLPILKIIPAEALNPRRIITIIPLLTIWSYIGLDALLRFKRFHWAARFAVALLVLTPWLIGIQVNTDTTMWGPGFDIKTEHPQRLYGKDIERIDNRIQLNDIRPMLLDAGFAVPFEGPRPVWGYADVFFGGKWRKLLNKLNDERDQLLIRAKKDKSPIFQQDWGVNLMVNLVRMGYTTHESRKSVEIDNTFYERRFFSGTDTLMFVYPHNGEHLVVYDSFFLKKIGDHFGVNKVYLYFYSSSILTEFINRVPSQTATFGPTTGIYYFNKNTEQTSMDEN